MVQECVRQNLLALRNSPASIHQTCSSGLSAPQLKRISPLQVKYYSPEGIHLSCTVSYNLALRICMNVQRYFYPDKCLLQIPSSLRSPPSALRAGCIAEGFRTALPAQSSDLFSSYVSPNSSVMELQVRFSPLKERSWRES